MTEINGIGLAAGFSRCQCATYFVAMYFVISMFFFSKLVVAKKIKEKWNKKERRKVPFEAWTKKNLKKKCEK